uniref:RNA helicase n=1 Tax=Photinus pyralis TaxID=7054 RepID=A0A1Y1L0B3_PHOPY
MDAFDIFKKLTQGARFKRNSTRSENPASTFTYKTALPEKVKLEDAEQSQAQPESDEGVDVDEKALTLLGTITSDKPKLKRKKPSKLSNEEREKIVHEQAVNRTRNQLHINVSGSDIPEPIVSFDQLSIPTDLIVNLKRAGYNEPTTIQKQCITVMLEGRQVLACAPTGSGKTAAFVVPLIHHLKGPQRKGFRAVIVCPTRELARQTQRECLLLSLGRGFRIHVIHKKALTQYAPKSSQKFDLLVTTPNSLCYLLKQEPPVISLANVEWLIIDEADKLFETGLNSFRDQMEEILLACSNKDRKIGMFSATLTTFVDEWCKENMADFVRITVGQKNAATDLVDQQLLFVGNEGGKLLAFRDIVRKGLQPPVLVFVQSKDRAQQLFSELIFDGINVDAIHSDRTQTQVQ